MQDSDLIWDNIRELHSRIQAMGTVLWEIWCVDNPSWVDSLRAATQWQASPNTLMGCFGGTRLFVVDTKLAMPDSLPWYGRIKGVWLIFSDGSKKTLEGTM